MIGAETLKLEGLDFEVRRSLRRKTLGLTVDRVGDLVIHAPVASDREELERWTRKKLLWVHQKLALKNDAHVRRQRLEFVTGECFTFLGRAFRLKVVRHGDVPLHSEGRELLLRESDTARAAELVRRWYIENGRTWLQRRVPFLARKAGEAPRRIEVRDLGFRWGSCGAKRTLFFNWRLLQLSVRLVDYVIVHELIHLREPHHGAAFWTALEAALPDWKSRRDELAAIGPQVLDL